MPTTKYYFIPFATSGDLVVVPNPTAVNGSISYTQGWPFDYQRNLASDPAAKPIDRGTMNQIFLDLTTNIQQYQQFGAPNFITSADNNGSAFSYAKNAVVYQPVDGKYYQSTAAANTAVPPGAGWAEYTGGGAVTSVFSRIGAVTAQTGDYTTAQVTESGNLYFTNARAIAAVLTGFAAGAGTVTSSDSILTALQKVVGNIAALPTSVFTKTFAPVDQSITYGTANSLAHGLGAAPKLIFMQMVCQTAEAEYSIGDVITVAPNQGPSAGGGLNDGLAVYADSTNLSYRFSASGFLYTQKTTGTITTLTAANWKMRPRAYA